jgi:fused signal recognition particle receptor
MTSHTSPPSAPVSEAPSETELQTQTERPKKGLLSRIFGRKSQEKLLQEQPRQEQPAHESVEPIHLSDPSLGHESDPDSIPRPEETLATFSVARISNPPENRASEKQNWWQRLTKGLLKTSSTLSARLASLLFQRKLDADTLEELEDILIQADLGLPAAAQITQVIKSGRFDKAISADEVKEIMAQEIERILTPVTVPFSLPETPRPFVILMVGVNGSGKTTSIGKLAHLLQAQGKKIMLAAGDTFRAAAIEQLKVWGTRTHSPVIAREQGADASGLVYDAYQAAVQQNMDVLLVDTAGRLQNKAGLMAELEKMVRVLKKADARAPHACLLVLDATVGQNAISQVELFSKTAGVTGLIMTKLDGTARGGILVALAQKFQLPIHFIGVGESFEDLEPFQARDFARAIAGMDEE